MLVSLLFSLIRRSFPPASPPSSTTANTNYESDCNEGDSHLEEIQSTIGITGEFSNDTSDLSSTTSLDVLDLQSLLDGESVRVLCRSVGEGETEFSGVLGDGERSGVRETRVFEGVDVLPGCEMSVSTVLCCRIPSVDASSPPSRFHDALPAIPIQRHHFLESKLPLHSADPPTPTPILACTQ